MHRVSSYQLDIPIGFFAFVGLGLFDGVLGVAWPSMRGTFGVGLEAIGILLLALTVGFSITSLFIGQILAYLPLHVVLVGGALLRVLSMLVGLTTPVWWLLVAAILGFGVGAGVIDSALNVYFAHYHQPSHVNWLHACFGLGATLGPLLMTVLFAADLTWRWGLAAIGLFHVVLALSFALTRRHWAYGHEDLDLPGERPPGVRVLDTLRLPAVWLSILIFFLYSGLEMTTGQLSFTLFTEGRGIPDIAAGRLVSLYWGSFTAGRFAIGFLADRVNLHILLRACLLAAVVGAGLLWWNPINVVSFAGLGLIGIALSAIFPTLIATTPRRLGAGHAAHAIGFQIGGAGAGIGVLPGLAGLLAARAGLEIIGPFVLGAAALTFFVYELLQLFSPGEASADPQGSI